MNSDSPSLQQLIQSGNPQAIAQALSKSLAAGGVKISKCDRQGSTLRMLLVGEKIDRQQKHAIEFLQQQFVKLEIPDLSEVIVYGQKSSDVMPVWHEIISLKTDSNEGLDDFYLEEDQGNDDEASHTDAVSYNTQNVTHDPEEQPPSLPLDHEDFPPPLPISPPKTSPQPKVSRSGSTAKHRKPPMPPSRLVTIQGSTK